MPVSMILLAAATVAAPDPAQDDRRWNGIYAGITAGLDLSGEDDATRIRADHRLDTPFDDRSRTVAAGDASTSGFCGGGAPAMPSAGCRRGRARPGYAGHIGYDLQFGDVVIGAIGEAGRGGIADPVAGAGASPVRHAFVRTLDWSAQGRLRAGYALGDTLPYVTGGATLARIDHNIVGDAAIDDAGRDRRGGWGYLVGGGIDRRVSPAMSVGLLYTYSSVADAASSARIDATGGDRRFDWHSARVRASIRF